MELHYHCAITEPTAMCCLCCWIKFCSTQYNTPRSFCLAGYSDVFCDRCPASKQSTNHSNCTWPLRRDSSEPNTTLSHTNSQVGFVLRSAPPVTLYAPWFLAKLASRYAFFPTHLLHCYIHRSYQWTLPRGSEQACLNEPLLADLCRHTSVGCVTTVILRKRQAAYRSLSTP